jgi:C4-dicarboxylate-specific signal transduction histidine kinase
MAFNRPSTMLPVATAAVASIVFAADALTPSAFNVSVLYVVVVLMAGRFSNTTGLWIIAAGCVSLTLLAQIVSTWIAAWPDPSLVTEAFNAVVSALVVALSAYLIVRGRAAETALQRAQANLADISRTTTLSELTAAIGHEVNQPIAAIVTNAGACLRWLELEAPNLEKAREAANRIVRDGTRASEIIARIRRMFGSENTERRQVDINQVIRESAALLGAEAARQAIVVRVNLAADIPGVIGDSIQLQQVLVNLMLNAFDAMRELPGTRELTIHTSMQQNERVLVAVCDTGCGIAPSHASTLFDPFITTKPNGIGMGLSISRSIIEAHEGRLWAAPNTPRGSIFLFELPVWPAKTQPIHPPKAV